MSNPLAPGDSKDIAKRFRRILDSDEYKDESQNIDESILEEADQNQLLHENETKTIHNGLPLNPDASGLAISTEKAIIEEIAQNQANEELVSDILDNNLNPTPIQNISGESPALVFPQIDEYGMPLPGRTQKLKISSSQDGLLSNIYPHSKIDSTVKGLSLQKVNNQQHTPLKDLASRKILKRRPSSISFKQGMGCFLRMFLLAALAGIILLLAGGSIVLYEYYKIAATLPSVADLQQRASTFETTRIFDRNGNLLYEILDPTAGRRTFITLDKISPIMVAATIATEDKSFYNHPGFDWTAIVRPFWQNFQEGGTVSGAP